MGRLNWFIFGSCIGGLQVLNTVYENEQLKEQVKRDIQVVQRIRDNVRITAIKEFTIIVYRRCLCQVISGNWTNRWPSLVTTITLFLAMSMGSRSNS